LYRCCDCYIIYSGAKACFEEEMISHEIREGYFLYCMTCLFLAI
jgi:hypothetical protein